MYLKVKVFLETANSYNHRNDLIVDWLKKQYSPLSPENGTESFFLLRCPLSALMVLIEARYWARDVIPSEATIS